MYSALRVAAVVAVLAIGTTFAISPVEGPGEEPVAPAAEAPTPQAGMPVTGTAVDYGGNQPYFMKYEMSDPRVSGTAEISWATDFDPSGGYADSLRWGTITLRNDGGTWAGEFAGFAGPDSQFHVTIAMQGGEGYEGLSFVASQVGPVDEHAVTGEILPGELPPQFPLASE
jgi:hypothetical protein